MNKLSIQLWTVRREIAELGMEATLQRLAELGYPAIEPAGLGGLAPTEFKAVADGLGLQISSAHVPLPVGPDANQVLDEQEAIGNRFLISGGMAPDMATLDDTRRLADRFNEAAANAAARGMHIGMHNHWWEFDTVLDDGACPFDVLLDATDVFLEVDVYWAAVGGVDPAGLLKDLGDRVRYLHVKDGPIEPRTPQTPVGAGKLDIGAVLEAAPADAWQVVELDEFDGDMFHAVDESRRWLTAR